MIMTDEVEKKVISILAQQALLNESDVTPESTLSELNLDSLSVVEIIFSLEEYFDINIPFNANDPASSEFVVDNVSTIVSGVKSLITQKS